MVTAFGWAWLIGADGMPAAIAPAQGVAQCRGDEWLTYRAGRVDVLKPVWFQQDGEDVELVDE